MSKYSLTEKEIGLLEWNSATLDMRFVDDNPDGVEAIIEAQLAKAEPLIRADERKKVLEEMISRADAGLAAMPDRPSEFFVGYWRGVKQQAEERLAASVQQPEAQGKPNDNS